MKNKDVRIGMKVIPHDKTDFGFGNAEQSETLQGILRGSYRFLYVLGWDKELECWILSENPKGGGDFYSVLDFEPYEKIHKRFIVNQNDGSTWQVVDTQNSPDYTKNVEFCVCSEFEEQSETAEERAYQIALALNEMEK